ncbi:hypothetical protein AtubIFM54640_009598 [Aspergillus tubingensis]|nr:hypothetical protein AtubIFM54640_009598 [Aspergillus tubingensis]GLA92159.1 hypothetical protein AtubIFM57143_006822 [Aspergillus tubingensis]GLB14578.1 hypothetical protein AtubIFM61612_004370 [Aspergillus tubingensis]
MVLTGRLMFTFKKLHDTYGPVVRIGPSELSFATNSAFDTIYGPYGDNNFSLYGSRKGLLGSLHGMADSLGNSTEKDNRRMLRPLVATSLNELLGAKGEQYCHLAMAEQLAFHNVGQTEAAPVPLSTLNNRYLWQFANMAAFGNRGDEAGREAEVLSVGAAVDELSDDCLARLPYLNACINETFRITPAFNGGILQRVSWGATVDGIYVPPGVAVSVDHYTLGHAPQYWEKPDIFNPDRWIDQNCKDNFKASRPFLIGARQCPGRQMAYQMFRVCVAKLVYLYSLELVNNDFDIERDTFSSYHWTGVKLDVTMKPRTPGVFGY